MNANYTRLKRYFEDVDQRVSEDYLRRTGIEEGLFIPSPLMSINHILLFLIERGIINVSKPFLDAGCGDGRIVALAALYGPSIGVEYDEGIYRIAEEHIRNLESSSVLSPGAARIIKGDL